MQCYFRIQDHNTTISKEILCGTTTFLTMSYILFVSPAVVSESGMPVTGVFVATALSAALCCFIMGFIGNAPFGMASGMGLNTFFTYMICSSIGFHWREALAMVFIAGLLHIVIMGTGLRKSLVNAIPHHLRISFGVGLGLFIGYIGLKSARLLMFTTPPGQYEQLQNGTIISNSSVVPGISASLAEPQMIALIGMVVIIILIALERKTGESYAAFPVGILVATFVGVPMNVTNLSGVHFIDLSAILEIREVFASFLGSPGLLSLLEDPHKLMMAALIIMIILVTNVMDSIGTLLGIGQLRQAEIFTEKDVEGFQGKGAASRLDRVFLCNSLGGSIGAMFGTTTVTTFTESITGIVSGGRTGLVSVVIGCYFLLCLPLANFFNVIPATAIAPALIVAGAFMFPLAARINWTNFEEGFPAFMTALCIPLTYGFIYGIAAGVLSHVLIQITVGKAKAVHPMLYAISLIFILVVATQRLL